jgi:methylmalonyl-CoA mutase N-terminal domain/subunit
VLKAFKSDRSKHDVEAAIGAMARACDDTHENLFERVVEAAVAGVTHGEICACLRERLGFGEPQVVA